MIVEILVCVHLFLGVFHLVASLFLFQGLDDPLSLTGLGLVQSAVVIAVFTPWFAWALFGTDALAIYIVDRERTQVPAPRWVVILYVGFAGGIGAAYLGLVLFGAHLNLITSPSHIYAIGGYAAVARILVIVAISLVPLGLISVGVRAFQRTRVGRCGRCGYDLRRLRSTPDVRCPECGECARRSA